MPTDDMVTCHKTSLLREEPHRHADVTVKRGRAGTHLKERKREKVNGSIQNVHRPNEEDVNRKSPYFIFRAKK